MLRDAHFRDPRLTASMVQQRLHSTFPVPTGDVAPSPVAQRGGTKRATARTSS